MFLAAGASGTTDGKPVVGGGVPNSAIPKFGEPGMLPGGFKFGWLRKLNASARNTREPLSPSQPTRNVRLTETSRLINPGPANALRPDGANGQVSSGQKDEASKIRSPPDTGWGVGSRAWEAFRGRAYALITCGVLAEIAVKMLYGNPERIAASCEKDSPPRIRRISESPRWICHQEKKT